MLIYIIKSQIDRTNKIKIMIVLTAHANVHIFEPNSNYGDSISRMFEFQFTLMSAPVLRLIHPGYAARNYIEYGRQNINLNFNLKFSNKQDRNQPHSPGWARVPLSSLFLKFQTYFLFFSNFPNFSTDFGPLGDDSPTRDGPGYATEN